MVNPEMRGDLCHSIRADPKTLKCADCGGLLLRQRPPESWNSHHDWVYCCENFPQCKGKLSAHRDGKPRGVPATEEERGMRMQCHELFDAIWSTTQERNKLYQWLAHKLGMSKYECHFSKMKKPELVQALEVLRSLRAEQVEWQKDEMPF